MQNNVPIVRVTIDGMVTHDIIAIKVRHLGYYGADRFMVDIPLGLTAAMDANYFNTLGSAEITVEVIVPSSVSLILFIGQIDNVRIDILDRTVQLCGRDLSARLIDTEISEAFLNQTSSQIVQLIAARHGLTPNVTPTSTSVGQYYELDHARSVLGINSRSGSEWDLLSRLAQLENFDLSVTGTVLNFNMNTAQSPLALNVHDCINLYIDVAKTLPVSTSVKSWNTRSKNVISESSGIAIGASASLIKPNLTTGQAQELVKYHQKCLMQHSSILIAKMPGELDLMPAIPVFLYGTESTLDQVYMIDSVVREITTDQGFVQTLRAHALIN
ncbi:MAG: hypothetical protein B7W99_00305 [Rhodospirillales bacterium 20-58-10]|nr:MAG: hypothetical protein B7W99_00305 [Rhodospirillales bacterium 20-58-10]